MTDSESTPSNMGRCVVCGSPIDLESGDRLALMEGGDLEDTDFDEQDRREAMAEALRRDDAPESHTLAKAYEDGKEIIMHEECHDKTYLTELYTEAAV